MRWREKAQNLLFYKVAITATSLAILFVPLLALANPFSLAALLAGFGRPANAESVDILNSQRMDLLSPATNLDPNPSKGTGDLPVEGGAALAANIGPSGTAADVVEQPTSSQISVYTVHAGDTLSSIAAMFGVSVNTIVWANDIRGGTIHEGDQLIIPPVTGVNHQVVKGETIAALAKTYQADPHDIASYNGLADDAALTPGQDIFIPDGVLNTSVSTPTPKHGKSGSTGKSHPSNSHAHPSSSVHGVSSFEPYLGGSGPAIPAYFTWPVAGGQITQGLHGWNAVDIGAPRGTSIYAAAAGTVIIARGNDGWNGGYGNYVVISHANGTQTLYAHMSQVLVSSGSSVSQGQTIGLVGATGKAYGAHLHFEVRGAENPFAN